MLPEDEDASTFHGSTNMRAGPYSPGRVPFKYAGTSEGSKSPPGKKRSRDPPTGKQGNHSAADTQSMACIGVALARTRHPCIMNFKRWSEKWKIHRNGLKIACFDPQTEDALGCSPAMLYVGAFRPTNPQRIQCLVAVDSNVIVVLSTHHTTC